MTWMRCTACKRDIKFGVAHWVCSVSTCNRRNTDYKFCSVACWDSHVATLRHRDSWAVEARAPSQGEWQREQADTAAAAPAPGLPVPASPARPATEAPRRVVAPPTAAPASASASAAPAAAQGLIALAQAERDMLIVVSKLKKYIRDRSGMNCSDSVADILSDHVRAISDDAIRAAGADGRKTVLDRDVPKPRR